ncbi:MAG TPA: alpha-hydroxy acid oxidase [Rubrivivax sp.]|nr:alpha-hydroxy-acid oxidizing protein [Burkholderiales bacterium]HNT39468.1 alpha-hydroxy acid oxidase [Rubrivivax sp.]
MLLNFADLRASARRRLPRFVFDYLDGAAEDERCLHRNAAALERLHLQPTCLRDTAEVDTAVEVFGARWAAPFGVAPIGLCGLVRPGGDLLMARAAAAAGLPYMLSTASNARLEAVREVAGAAPQWLQLYVMGERGIAEQMVRRARQAGFGALVLTVDVAVSGMRERDVRNGFALPFRPGPAMLLDMLLHPGWAFSMLRHGAPNFVNLTEDGTAGSAASQAAMLARTMDRRLGWESLTWLRRLWAGPLLLKGVLHPEDGRRALKHGIDGLIVSNHGGRQLDAVPASVSALPAVLDAVDGRIPVFVDSGFRRGSDVVKALALGAKGVFVGRPVVFGMAAHGEAGARGALDLFATELQRTMILLGAPRIADIERGHVVRADPHA